MRLPDKPIQKILSPQEKRLTFGEHLEELRGAVIKSIAATVLAALLCLFFQDELMAILRRPYDQMTRKVEERRASREEGYETLEVGQEKYLQWKKERAARMESVKDPVLRTFLAHQDETLDQLTQENLRMRGDERKIRSIKPTAVFIAYLKTSLIAAIFLASPIILYQIWMFIAAGLYSVERRYVLTFLPLSVLLFLMGILFGYFVLVPIGLAFLAGYAGADVLNSFTLDNYLSLFITLTLLLGLVFELPLGMIFACRIGVVSPDDFARYRRYSLLFAVTASALLTPPDPATQLLMAGPLVILYEMGIWLSRLFAHLKKD